MASQNRKLKVFLCHASNDKDFVKILYHHLTNDGIDVWLDDQRLLPGQKWETEIPKAVKEADAVIVCLSKTSVTKEGYIQKEIKFALDYANEKPEDAIYLIPAKLEDCDMPSSLKGWQWVVLSSDKIILDEAGYSKLIESLIIRANYIGAMPPNNSLRISKDDAQTKIEFEFSDLRLNLVTRQVFRGDRAIRFSKTEFQLLQLFMEKPEQVLHRELIRDAVWGDTVQEDSNIIEVYIRYLRDKLEENGESRLIHTARGWGYIMRE